MRRWRVGSALALIAVSCNNPIIPLGLVVVFCVRAYTNTEHYAGPMSRRSSAVVERLARTSLADALDGLGVVCEVTTEHAVDHEPISDFVVAIGGQLFDAEVKTVVTAAQSELLTHQFQVHRRPVILVAERIATDAKRALRDAGINYFDMRGELRIVQPPLFIDAIVREEPYAGTRSSGPLDSQVAKEVAIVCLETPDIPHGVRELGRCTGRSPSAISTAMRGLRDAGLLTSAGEALCPDLFHELLAVWRSKSMPLANLPDTESRAAADRLGLGQEAVDTTAGWALTDTLAAISWGVPIVATGNYPPDFYVPTGAELRAAQLLLGVAGDPETRACTVAVAPVRLVCSRRVDRSGVSGQRWPVVSHIVAALDIALDKARGLEALDQWTPEGITRAW